MMPKYTVQDSKTGKKITFEWLGDNEPTQEDIQKVFESAAQQEPQMTDRNRMLENRPEISGELKPAHEMSGQPSRLERTARESARIISPVARPVLEGTGSALGALVGGIAGAETGPGAIVTATLGGGVGYGVGKGAADWLDMYAGIKKPYSGIGESLKQSGEDVATGMALEAGGQVVGSAIIPVFRGGKWVFKRVANLPKALFSKKAIEESAGKILSANTSEGVIYAKNAEEALRLEKEIPGLKFTMGQRTGDPGLIKLERTQMRAPGAASGRNSETIATNNEALRKYYEKNFPGKEGVDDIIEGLTKKQKILSESGGLASTGVKKELQGLSPQEPQVTGQKLLDELNISKSAAKEQSAKLYKEVPETQVDVKNMLNEFDEISKPMSRYEDAGNIPPILSAVKESVEDGKIDLNDLHGLRSELLAQSRQAKSAINPNERLASRLSMAAKSVEKAISAAETGGRELRGANKFFRENYIETFKQGAVGDIMRRGPRGESTRIEIAQIPNKIWNVNNLKASDDLIKAIGKEKSKSIMRDHAAYDLMKNVTDVDGRVVSNKLSSWIKKNGEILAKFGIKSDFDKILKAQRAVDMASDAAIEFEKSIAGRILRADPEVAIAEALRGSSPGIAAEKLMKRLGDNKDAVRGLQNAFADHVMNIVQTTAKDIANNPTISNAAFIRTVKKYMPAMKQLYKNDPQKLNSIIRMQRAYEIATRNTRSPIGGGSDTAENILTKLSNVNLLSRTASVARGIFKYLKGYSDKQIDELVTRALFDPEYAQVLIKASRKNVDPKEIRALINNKIIQLDEYRKLRAGYAIGSALASGQ